MIEESLRNTLMNDMLRDLTINIDIDNTVNDFIEQFILFYNGITGKKLDKSSVFDYDLCTVTGVDRHTLNTLFFKNNEFFKTLSPLPLCQIIIENLVEFGQNVRFVTAVDYDVASVRVDFVKTYFPFLDVNKQLIITDHKESIWADLVIDDNPKHLSNRNPNCKFILFDKPWNRNISVRNRCYNWNDIENFLIVEKFSKLHTLPTT